MLKYDKAFREKSCTISVADVGAGEFLSNGINVAVIAECPGEGSGDGRTVGRTELGAAEGIMEEGLIVGDELGALLVGPGEGSGDGRAAGRTELGAAEGIMEEG